MLKYVNTAVTFAEIPDEISLCINISNCPCHCEGCHSSYLAKDIGKELGEDEIVDLLLNNKGITCICFMGGDVDPSEINLLASIIRDANDTPGCWADVKIAWYSGRQELSDKIDLKYFDYIKLGPYIKDRGPLNNPNTNQRMYKIVDSKLEDITNKFWK